MTSCWHSLITSLKVCDSTKDQRGPKGGVRVGAGEKKREFLVCLPRPSRRSGGAEGREGGGKAERRGGEKEEEKAEWIHAGVSDPHQRQAGSHPHTLTASHPHVSFQPPALSSEDADLMLEEDPGLSAPPAEQRTPVSAPRAPPPPSAAKRRKTPALQVPDFPV